MIATKTLIVLLIFSLITAAVKVEGKVEGMEEKVEENVKENVEEKVEGMEECVEEKVEGMEECVMLFFNRDTKKNINDRPNYIRCKDKLRKVGIHYKLYGVLSREYVEALKKVPKFKNDEASLNRFLSRLALTYSRKYRRYRGKHIRN
ncbi:hypothetical protein LguiB_021541 [Lonicera macranthoides]